MCTDASIMSGEGVRAPVVTRGIITSYPFGGMRQHVCCLACKICVAPVVMKGFELKVIITELFADCEPLGATELALVIPTGARRVHTPRPDRLKELAAGTRPRRGPMG